MARGIVMGLRGYPIGNMAKIPAKQGSFCDFQSLSLGSFVVKEWVDPQSTRLPVPWPSTEVSPLYFRGVRNTPKRDKPTSPSQDTEGIAKRDADPTLP